MKPLVKETAAALGAHLCGIAPIDRFTEAPEGFHPSDVLPACKSVIVLARRFNPSALHAKSTSPYTIIRNDLSHTMNHLVVRLSDELDARGVIAVPIGSIGPDDYDHRTGKYRGTISLKHAGVLAGLGQIGKNTLLVNGRLGNMIWLSAVLTSAELKADQLATYSACVPSCNLCIAKCPVKALDGATIDQSLCRSYAFGAKDGNEWRIHCHTCRSICPNRLGLRS